MACITGIHQRYLPGFTLALVDLHVIVNIHVEGDIAGMQEVIGEIFLDQIALIATADDEFIDAEVAVDLEDVPEDRLAAYLHHRFGLELGFFA